MATRKPKPDAHAVIVDAVNRATDSEPARGEDLLPDHLKQAYLDAKKKVAKKRPQRKGAGARP